MAEYKELIKKFENIRSYARDFYIYGFKSRDDYTKKSGRSYDNGRRRLESWLDGNIFFNRTSDKKNVFISIDSRSVKHNPLFKALKSKSFTDGDIFLHFVIFDILYSPNVEKTLSEIVDDISEYTFLTESGRFFDESTIRKKLDEYIKEGLIVKFKKGRLVSYRRAEDVNIKLGESLGFFSEVMPCGVLGSYIADKYDSENDFFRFKHHYIVHALDSEILCLLFLAMHRKQEITIKKTNRGGEEKIIDEIVPLSIFVSVQSGRQYLMAYRRCNKKIISFRLDYICSVREIKTAPDFDELRQTLKNLQKNIWGVSCSKDNETEHIEFIIKCTEKESYIYNRLMREKRCGTVEKIDSEHYRFSADVFDTTELITWIRTFIGRITYLKFSNKALEEQFNADMNTMYQMYNIDGEQDDI